MTSAQYFPQIFDAPNLDYAKRIILTEEGPDASTEARWAIETPYVLELISRSIRIRPGMVVLDYGCGIGRMAKALIEAADCTVIGLDISPNMLKLARDYVASPGFIPLTPPQFDALCGAGLRVDAFISVWVLQHCFAPGVEIARICQALAPAGEGFVLNMPTRAVPAMIDGSTPAEGFRWASDGIDVATLLREAFDVAAEGAPDPARTPNMADTGAFWMSLRTRPT